MQIPLRLKKHEGYNKNIGVFSEQISCNEIYDPWSVDCWIPKIIFKSRKKFKIELPEWEIIHYKNVEFLKFANSGGVIAKTNYLKLNPGLLKLQDRVDQYLNWILPKVFSLQIQVVLIKTS